MKIISKKLKATAFLEMGLSALGVAGLGAGALVLDFSALQMAGASSLCMVLVNSLISGAKHYSSAKKHNINPVLNLHSLAFQPVYNRVVARAVKDYINASESHDEKVAKVMMLNLYCFSFNIYNILTNDRGASRLTGDMIQDVCAQSTLQSSIDVTRQLAKMAVQSRQVLLDVYEDFKHLGLVGYKIIKAGNDETAQVLLDLQRGKLTPADLHWIDAFNDGRIDRTSHVFINEESVKLFKEVALNNPQALGKLKELLTSIERWKSPCEEKNIAVSISDSGNFTQRSLQIIERTGLMQELEEKMAQPVASPKRLSKL